MAEEDARSVTVDILRPRIFKQTSNDTIQKKCIKRAIRKIVGKPSDISIRKYYLPIDEPIGHDIFKRDCILLSYKLYSKQQSRDKRRQRLAIRINERYKITSTDLRMRLHVSDLDNSRAKSDDREQPYIHKHIRVNNNYLYKTLKCLFSKQLSIRQEIGYKKDLIFNIDDNIKEEQRIYDSSFKRYKSQVQYLDAFIANDYQKSKEFLTKCDVLRDKQYEKIVELQNLASERNKIASSILRLDYKYRLQQYYGRFLYYLSAPSWRARHREFAKSVEIEAKGFDFGTTNEEDTFNVIFERLQKEIWSGLIRPPLYFTCPSDLMNIFETIEKQELNHFIHVRQIEPQVRAMRNSVKYLRDLVEHDSATVASTIGYFEETLKFSEENCSLLRAKFYEIVNGTFYDSLGAPDVLKLKLHLEFVYENVFNEKPINMDMINVARALERMYIEYNKQLDGIHSDKVFHAMVHYMKVERMRFQRAKAAARELRQFEILQQSLLRAYGPPSNKLNAKTAVPVPSKRKQPIPERRQTNESIKLDLTDAEIEYLTLFTDWTGHEDPSKYLHRSSVLSKD